MAVLADGQCAISEWRLAQSEYLGSDDCTIADMAVWPWHDMLVMGQLYEAGESPKVQN